MSIVLTYRYRLRDKHAAELNRQAEAVNIVWNYANEACQRFASDRKLIPTGFQLSKMTSGSAPLLDLSAGTITDVCCMYSDCRFRAKKRWLKFRGQKSLGWIPFKRWGVLPTEDYKSFVFRGITYQTLHDREIPRGAVFKNGSFNADARGRWYLNLVVEFQQKHFEKSATGIVGIDLGIKTLAALSTGEKIAAPMFYKQMQPRYASAQRAHKKRLVRTIAAKIANRRKDHLHKISNRLARTYGTIIVGNVSSSKLARTHMAKSVFDAGWSMLRAQLSYKAIRHGGIYLKVDEHMTSQTCPSCGALPPERPSGLKGLRIREWTCGNCGAVHDRDVAAAINIARRGSSSLAEGADKAP